MDEKILSYSSNYNGSTYIDIPFSVNVPNCIYCKAGIPLNMNFPFISPITFPNNQSDSVNGLPSDINPNFSLLLSIVAYFLNYFVVVKSEAFLRT